MYPLCTLNTVDLADSGIRNTTTVFDNPERDRVRLVSYLVDLSKCWLPTR
jgi:hypothetical protein